MRELILKIKEALLSALPITLIVYALSLLPWFNFTGTELIVDGGMSCQLYPQKLNELKRKEMEYEKV